ncbi:MAG: c-type cytochrome [Xanthobacteraceae bacterium]|jgi:mono/diheme cytochrome c family protein
MKPWINAGGAMLLAAFVLGAATGMPPGRAAETPSPADAAAQIAHGKVLFISYGCGWCHEAGGRKQGRGPQLMDTVRDDEFIINRIVGGSQGRMPAFGNQLVDTDIRALIAYIRSLKPET